MIVAAIQLVTGLRNHPLAVALYAIRVPVITIMVVTRALHADRLINILNVV